MTSLVGREREVQEVCALLRGEARLVTLTGPGGVGKTRLALHVAGALVGDDRDGVYFVDLQPVQDPGLVAPSIARELGVRVTSGVSVVEGVIAELHEKNVLIVLDNFEQVINAAFLLTELLSAIPGLRLLVTSREVLKLTSEYVYVVPPLALPEPKSPLVTEQDWVQAVTEADATRLFVARARQVRIHFAVTLENAESIATIGRLLDGLPLAIELAAAQLNVLTLPVLRQHLASRPTLLAARLRDQPTRHQTMEAAIAWSYSLLTSAEQRLFRRLAVFAGGFDLDVVNALGEDDAFGNLTALIGKSLLTRSEETDAEPRFAYLETIRAFALERLAETGEGEDARRWHATYYFHLVEGADLFGPRYPYWFARLDAEHPNLRAAYTWCRSRGELTRQARFIVALGWPWLHLGFTAETRGWAEETAAALAHSGATPLRAGVLYAAGLAAYGQGDLAIAETRFVESRAIWGQLANEPGGAWAQVYLSHIARDRGDYHRARDLLEAALARFRLSGERWAEGFTLTRLGLAAAAAGDGVAARKFHCGALDVWRELGDEVSVATTLGYLGSVERMAGNLGKAAAYCVEALVTTRNVPWRNIFAERLASLAGVAVAIGDPVRAARLIGATMACLRATRATRLLPSTRAIYERDVATVRAQLGEAAYARETASGAALSGDALIAEGLGIARGVKDRIESAPVHGLTAREGELLVLLARGQTNQEIADHLVISLRTVERHLTNIYGKIGARNRAEATVFALTHGLSALRR